MRDSLLCGSANKLVQYQQSVTDQRLLSWLVAITLWPAKSNKSHIMLKKPDCFRCHWPITTPIIPPSGALRLLSNVRHPDIVAILLPLVVPASSPLMSCHLSNRHRLLEWRLSTMYHSLMASTRPWVEVGGPKSAPAFQPRVAPVMKKTEGRDSHVERWLGKVLKGGVEVYSAQVTDTYTAQECFLIVSLSESYRSICRADKHSGQRSLCLLQALIHSSSIPYTDSETSLTYIWGTTRGVPSKAR
ncbi:hypothetical protein HYDPIDRAFT_112444 [Hydnomerulius pinastri MD-312]|uniref:Uncharacterized protein n=1 Tax=Hydnomerulius pinastri MD-312 TaxID=994086 RepID=A0A0C9WEI2_9AGAM|nr:hypothetical protein HYDPIDRAFT_112444 [Hydnomerulius pinastri MD-312]